MSIRHALEKTAHDLWNALPPSQKRRLRVNLWGAEGIRRNGLEKASSYADYQPGAFPFGVNLYVPSAAEDHEGQLARAYTESLVEEAIPHCLIELPPRADDASAHRDSAPTPSDSPHYNTSILIAKPSELFQALDGFPASDFDKRFLVYVWTDDEASVPEEFFSTLVVFDELWVSSWRSHDTVSEHSPIPVICVPAFPKSTKARLDRIASFVKAPSCEGLYYNSTTLPTPFERSLYPDGINLFGFFRADLGIGQGARLYADALDETEISHDLIDADRLPLIGLSHNDTSCCDSLAREPKYNVNVACMNAPEFALEYCVFPQSFFDGRYNIGVWLWELEDLPAHWCDVFKYFNELWVPSRFVADAVRKASPLPVRVIPYGIEPQVDPTLSRVSLGLPEDDFLVLCMYDTNSSIGRKNPQASIEAFFKAFGKHSTGIRLVLKVRDPKADDLNKLHTLLGDCDNVIIFTDDLSREATNSLIACCDVYISLHRGEGFGLTMAEAMYLGVPTIATNWSANTDFMNSDVACMVDYELVPIKGTYQSSSQQARWADPDSDQAAGYLRLLHDDEQTYERFACAGRSHMREHFSLAASGELMSERIDELFLYNQVAR